MAKRTAVEPTYILHRYDWSESSLILDAFTRHHGRVALVAKGAKRPTSMFRPVLLPLQPLLVAYGGDAEIRTLKSAEWVGGHVMPTGEALLSGLYLNELLMRLLARDDPHPPLFDVYAQTVTLLATESASPEAALRAFELMLLKELGVLPELHMQTLSMTALNADDHYCLVPEGGLRFAGPEDRSLRGAQWVLVQQALDGSDFNVLKSVCAEFLSALKPQLRSLLHYHCGVPRLRTRQMMLDLQNL